MLIRADARSLPLQDACVDCCISSPPYFGLRDYGHAGQIGLEPSPADYVAAIVEVYREVWRVLKPSGTVWLNLGDSYSAGCSGRREGASTSSNLTRVGPANQIFRQPHKNREIPEGYKAKDLLGIPWRVAFALQADGWYLRSDIIWHKPNPMPESVQDRPTKSHEYLFLLAKGQSRTRRVLFSDLNPERVHFGLNFGKQTAASIVVKECVSLASAFFYAAQLENDFGLPPFYAEIWSQGSESTASNLGSGLPAIHRLATHAARFLNANTSTKEFLCEVQGIWGDLRKGDHFLISRGLAECSHAPSVLVDGDTAIAINHAGQIRKIQFLHGAIIDTVTTTCNYYYDAEAIAEPVSAAMLLEMEQGYQGLGLKEYEAAGVQNPSSVKARIIANAKKRITRGEGYGAAKGGFNGRTADRDGGFGTPVLGRNRRTVWTIPTMPYAGAHFATMPEKLVEPCILAGCPLGGLVLDPFSGSGTVLAVAERLSRRAVGVDLNPVYHKLAKVRTAQRGLRFHEEAS